MDRLVRYKMNELAAELEVPLQLSIPITAAKGLVIDAVVRAEVIRRCGVGNIILGLKNKQVSYYPLRERDVVLADLDNTLIKGSLGERTIRNLLGEATFRRALEASEDCDSDSIKCYAIAWAKFLKGYSPDQLRDSTKEAIADIELKPKMRRMIRRAYPTLLAIWTGTYVESTGVLIEEVIKDEYYKSCSPDKSISFLGTRLKTENGVYTGEVNEGGVIDNEDRKLIESELQKSEVGDIANEFISMKFKKPRLTKADLSLLKRDRKYNPDNSSDPRNVVIAKRFRDYISGQRRKNYAFDSLNFTRQNMFSVDADYWGRV